MRQVFHACDGCASKGIIFQMWPVSLNCPPALSSLYSRREAKRLQKSLPEFAIEFSA